LKTQHRRARSLISYTRKEDGCFHAGDYRVEGPQIIGRNIAEIVASPPGRELRFDCEGDQDSHLVFVAGLGARCFASLGPPLLVNRMPVRRPVASALAHI
jgi:hypothetical protein